MIEQNQPVMGDSESTDAFFETCGFRIHKALRRIIRAVDTHSWHLNHDFSITAPQMVCLYSLAKGGEMTQSQLAAQVNMGISTVNGIIDRLEKKQLITRRRDTKDRRKVFVTVTESGKEMTKSAPSLLQGRFSQALRNLGELEQAAIALSLERVVELMEAQDFPSAPPHQAHQIHNTA